MLQLTHDAATELADARRAQGLPDTCGIRVFGEPQAGDELAIGLTFAEVPAEDDEVTEREGTRLFVAPEVAAPLSSAALDDLVVLGRYLGKGESNRELVSGL